MINGILLGGLLALLALGLNLIFGVIDVTWICYAELVMIVMYGMYYLIQYYHLPYWAAAPLVILLVALLGAALHYLVIAPLLTAPPINQLLATGGVLRPAELCHRRLRHRFPQRRHSPSGAGVRRNAFRVMRGCFRLLQR